MLPEPVERFLVRAPFLAPAVRFGWRFQEAWNANDCPIMAAALAFYGLLSVFPITLAGVAILARLLANDAASLQEFSSFVASFFPGAAGNQISAQVENSVRAIASGPDTATVSLFALASLLWSGRAYFDTLALVLNRIWPGAQQRDFWRHQLTLWSLILGVGLLFLASSGLTIGLSLAQALAERAPRLFINRAPYFWDFLGKLASWILTFLMFYLLYRFAPNRTLPFKKRLILVSALVGALGWEVGKWAFARFLGNVARYEATYGSVAGVVVTMLWIYYASFIVLAGAQVGATLELLRAPKEAS